MTPSAAPSFAAPYVPPSVASSDMRHRPNRAGCANHNAFGQSVVLSIIAALACTVNLAIDPTVRNVIAVTVRRSLD
jgi:hypothetical protein